MQHLTMTALAVTLGSAAQAATLDINVDPGSEVAVDAPLFSTIFGVSGSIGIDAETDADGKLSNAGLCAADLLVASAGFYNFGPNGLLRLSNIGITLEDKGGQEYFFNETAGVPQPGDYAGFLDTDAVAGLSGEFGIDIDGDGTEEFTRDLSQIDEVHRVFDFEAIITRDGGSPVYTLMTDFFLAIDTGIDGVPLPITIEFSGGGQGIIPAPGTMAAVLGLGLVGARRRR